MDQSVRVAGIQAWRPHPNGDHVVTQFREMKLAERLKAT